MIVPLDADYIDEIVKIEKESFNDAWTREMFVNLLINPFIVCFVSVESIESIEHTETASLQETEVCKNKKSVSGYAVLHHMFSDGELHNIAVKSDKRRRHIAHELMTAIMGYAEKSGIEMLMLEVRKSNIAAFNLYKKFGFREISVRKNYYSNPVEDAIVMVCEPVSVTQKNMKKSEES